MESLQKPNKRPPHTNSIQKNLPPHTWTHTTQKRKVNGNTKSSCEKFKSRRPLQVYIRIVHRSKMGYIKTNKFIHHKQVSANGELKDPVVSEYCARAILKYNDLLNRKDITVLSVAEVIAYLTEVDSLENFSEYAKIHMRCGYQYVGATMRAKVESDGQPGSVSIDKTQYDPYRNYESKCSRLSLKN